MGSLQINYFSHPFTVMSGILALLISGSLSVQMAYAEMPIRLVLLLPPVGSADTVARLHGQQLADT